MYFLKTINLVTVAGGAFGADNYIRFSYAASDDDLKKAIKLLKDSLSKLNGE